ncbi:MAG: restriction endonuclease subunit S [Treponema sp.]|nr:restriction endonuclease subunit S [Treponema sp.]
MFEIVGTKSLDSNAIEFTKTGINFIGRTFENNGIQGKTQKREFEPNEPFTITATVIGNYKYVKYQKEPYYCSQNINKLTPKEIINQWSENIAYFFIANIQRFVSLYDGQQGGYKLDDINNHKIQLPIKEKSSDFSNPCDTLKTIDFDFMESFIRELVEERIRELNAYLLATGLKDYTLTSEEENALEAFKTIQWDNYRIGDLFEKINTKKLPYKAADLPTTPTNEYLLPCLTSSFHNQGLNYYAPKENATILKNVISIPSNSDVYRAYFQSRDFTVLSDAYAIKKKNSEIDFSPQHYLFCVMCINKVTDLPLYSYKTKLGGWNVVQDKIFQLPTKDGKPDYATMGTFIKAVEKLVIKDVVLYADSKIEATKNVVKKDVEYKINEEKYLLHVAQEEK